MYNYCEPPLEESFMSFKRSHDHHFNNKQVEYGDVAEETMTLPLVDLTDIDDVIKEEICDAARGWGFFQVVNHGVPDEVLVGMRREQVGVFEQPLRSKARPEFLGLSPNSYRWGNPRACCVGQLFWSETLHVSLSDVSRIDGCNHTLRSSIDEFASKVGSLAERIAGVLVEKLGTESRLVRDMCPRGSSYVRMNRYPPCPFSLEVLGLLPHTDSDLLTIVSQDNIGGLQLLKDGTWFSVKPNPKALIVNIGDLFQALSNDTYKSIKHRVIAHKDVERYSLAYFYCPSKDVVIENCTNKPPLYTKFSFHEYKYQILKDVQATGDKIDLSRFRI